MNASVKRVVALVVFTSVMVLGVSGFALAQKTVRISGFGGNDEKIVEELLMRYVKPIAEKEGIEVVYEPTPDNYQQALMNSLSAGTAADLFYMDIFWAKNIIQSSGMIEPLNDYLAKSEILNPDDIIPSLLDGFTIDGQIYGIPKDFNSLALFYNKDMFDLADVEYPNADDTLVTLEAKLAKVVETLKAEGVEASGLALQADYARMGGFAFADGWEPIVDNKTDLSDPKFLDAFSWYVGLKEKGLGVVPADIGQGWGGGALASEGVAACIEGAWIVGFLRDQAPSLEYGATLMPKSPKNGERGNFIFTVSWSMNKNSEHKAEAFRVIELLTSIEAQQWVLERGLAIPSRKALADNPYFQQEDKEAQANKVVFEGASDGQVKPYYLGQYGGDWAGPVNTALSEVLSGQASVEEAIKTAQERLDVDVMK